MQTYILPIFKEVHTGPHVEHYEKLPLAYWLLIILWGAILSGKASIYFKIIYVGSF